MSFYKIINATANIAKECIKDFVGINRGDLKSNKEHIEHAANWIIRSQEEKGGIAAWYSIIGYHKPYPEVTGDIIPTFFELYGYTKEERYKEKALKMANWLLSIQLKNGAFPGIDLKVPMVFDTGQILLGLVKAFKETEEIKYKIAMEKTAMWLCSVQGGKGNWENFTYKKGSRTYHSRIAWALLQAYDILRNEELLIKAKKNLEWVLAQQLDNGWFKKAAFKSHENPLLHTIAYTIEGLLEAGKYFASFENSDFRESGKRYVSSATKAADVLLNLHSEDGSLFGRYNHRWEKACNWKCLVGNAQTSIIWLKLHSLVGDTKYLKAAEKVNRDLKMSQNLKSKNEGINGGIKGSQPIYGRYMPFCYISWGAKFVIDALLLEEKLQNSY